MSADEILWDDDLLKAKILTIFKADALKCKFPAISKILIQYPEELKGKHFITEAVYVKVTFNDNTDKNLFLKIFSNNLGHRKITKGLRVMEKESAFYNEVLPEAQKFCESRKGCEGLAFEIFPSCLNADHDLILLENLVLDAGFEMLPMERPQNLATAKVVLSNLAKFHAVTYGLIQTLGLDQVKTKWPFLAEDDWKTNEFLDSIVSNAPRLCLYVLQGSPHRDVEDTVTFLTNYATQIQARNANVLETSLNSRMVALGHGDCWNNNMLFKLDSEKNVQKQVFVDMQCIRLASPIIDICNYLYSSVNSGSRREHLNAILQHYYNEFQVVLLLLQVPCPLSFDEFMDEFRRVCDYGLITSLIFLPAYGAMKEMEKDNLWAEEAEGVDAFSSAISAWVGRNRDKSLLIAEEIVQVVQEYRKLTEDLKCAN